MLRTKRWLCVRKMKGKKAVFLLQAKEQIYLQTSGPKEVLKGSLQNIKLISNLLRLLQMVAVLKTFKTILKRKILEKDITFTRVLQ